MTRDSDRLKFGRKSRLGGSRQFQQVFSAGVRCEAGPLLVYGCPNTFTFSRLGLTVSRKVGNAVKRARIKRLLREAFRLQQKELPTGYDFVIVVRPHAPMDLANYSHMLHKAAGTLQQRWMSRDKRTEADLQD